METKKFKVTQITSDENIVGVVVIETKNDKTVGYVEGNIEPLNGREVETTIVKPL